MIGRRETKPVLVQDSSPESAVPVTINTLPQTLTFC